MLKIKFNGDIEDFNSVSKFLSEHLDYAKDELEDIVTSYYSWNEY